MTGVHWTDAQLSAYGSDTTYTAPKSRRKHQGTEHQHQVALFERAALEETRYPELQWLHAVPNGGFRDPVTAARMKAEGVRAGIPDVCLPVARAQWHGLYIELKAPGRSPTATQKRCIAFLRLQGYCVHVMRDWVDAWEAIVEYLEGGV